MTGSHNFARQMHAMDWERSRMAWLGLLSARGARATGQAALVLHGVWGLPTVIRPEISMAGGGSARGVQGVRVRQFREPFEVVQIEGFPVAVPVQALAQALPELNLYRAVAVVDSAINRKIITSKDLSEVLVLLRGRRGIHRLGKWIDLVDGRAESPMESFARLDCWHAGLPAPSLQIELRDEAGGLIARSDLGWRRPDGSWLLVEIDGREVHDAPAALYQDRERQNRLLLHGEHLLLRFTGRDVMNHRVSETVKPLLGGR